MQGESSRLELRKVQQVVDDLKQLLGRVSDVIDESDLVWPPHELATQDAVEPQNGVHGRAQFMAHRGHEFILVGLCANEGLVVALQLGVACLQLGSLRAMHALGHPHHIQRKAGEQQLLSKGPAHDVVGRADLTVSHPISTEKKEQHVMSNTTPTHSHRYLRKLRRRSG